MFKVENIFTAEDIDTLNSIYDNLSPLIIKRYFNLFYLTKKDVADLPSDLVDEWDGLRAKLIKHTNLQPYSFYFLEYSKGSFCRAHTDNDAEVGLTSVTLVKKSDDLIGGDSIGYLPHWKSEQDVYDVNRYQAGDDCNSGEKIIPVVMKQDVGQTLTYEHNFKHSVSLVESGMRRVFIAWFKNDNKLRP